MRSPSAPARVPVDSGQPSAAAVCFNGARRWSANVTEPDSRPEPRGSLNVVLPLLEHLEREGFDPVAVLAAADIPVPDPAGPGLPPSEVRLPKRKFERLWQAAIDVTGDPAISLRAATLVRPSTLGVIGYLASASESRRNAFELVRDLTPLLWEDFECGLESDGEAAFIRFGAGRGGRHSRFTTEYAVGLAIAMSRHLGAARADPLEARFSHRAPGYAGEVERILRLPVRFESGEDGVAFPIALLDCSNPSADAALRPLLQQYASDQLARVLTRTRTASRVRAAVVRALPHGTPTARQVAADLFMSDRTLRRRLREEGTSYQGVLDEVRADLARAYLAGGRHGTDEVADRLGFSDASAFSKAFRRWTGRTPADYARERSGRAGGEAGLAGIDGRGDRTGPASRPRRA